MLTIDGSQGEGGGQMLRMALALSAITSTAFKIEKIRAGRHEPGLKPQHLAAIKATAQLCQGTAEGAELGSQEITFYPRQIKGGTMNIDIGTAGSITLLLQAVLLPALFADKPSRITITGGTDVNFAMPVDYFSEVFLPQIRPWAEKIEFKVLKRGYMPAGKGVVELFVKPKLHRSDFATFALFLDELKKQISSFSLIEQATLIFVRGVSHASRELEKDRVAERQAHAAQDALRKPDVLIRSEYSETASIGSGITLWAVFSKNKDDVNVVVPIRLGADALGQKGFPAELAGKTAAKQLLDAIASKAPVDQHLADNLVPFLAIAGGAFTAEKLTQHTHTAIEVAHLFLGEQIITKQNALMTTRQA